MRTARRENGFTLIELLVATGIASVVIVGALTLVASNHDAYRRGMTRAQTQQESRVALQRMSRELRMAGYDVSGVLAGLTSPTPIQTANASDLSFVADVTGDGTLDRVTYRVQGFTLVRELSSWDGSSFPAASSGEIADSVGLLTFAYFDDASPTNNALSAPVAAADLADIRRITISLVTTDSMADVDQTFPMVLDVRLRN